MNSANVTLTPNPTRSFKPLVDGQLLEVQTREFEILELRISKKAGTGKAAPPAKPPKKPQKKAADKTTGEPDADTMEEPDQPNPDEEENPDETEPDDDADDQPGQDEKTQRAAGAGDVFHIAISSEHPVERWFGTEILDHSPEAVDLSRAKRGLSFLVDHNSRDLVGLVENIHVDTETLPGGKERKVMRGDVRFSSNAPALAVRRDIEDGIRRFVSVGYWVHDFELVNSSETEGNTYRATRWTPLEASSVAVPADPTVGHNRKETRSFPVRIRSLNPAAKPTSEVSMPVEVKDVQTAAAEIIRLGMRHGIDQEEIAAMVAEGVTPAEASKRILAKLGERNGKPLSQPGAEQADKIDLTEREQADYNIARGIMAMVQNRELTESGSAKRVSCFELEVSDTIEKRSKQGSHGGMFVPWSIRHAHDPELEKKFPRLFAAHADTGRERYLEAGTRAPVVGLDSKTTAAGGALVFVQPGEFIQYLYNRMRVKELGARTITGLRENVAYPKQTGKVSGSWVAENPGTDVANAALTLAQIPSSPKTYQSSTAYSRQLLAQAVIDVDSLVREDLAMDMALAIDTAAINGTSGGLQPTGILNTTGVQAYTLSDDAGNGGHVTWKDCVAMTVLLETVNADQLGDGAFLTTPPIKGYLKNQARLANTIALPVWADDNTIDGYRARSTNQVPSNFTKGTGTNLHAFIRGIFETMIISMWGNGFELVVDPYLYKKQGMIELTTFMMVDVTLKYPSAFVVAKYCLTS